MLLLLVVLVFQHLYYCQGQKIVDCRTLNGHHNCVRFPDCRVGPSLVQKQNAAVCGFQNGMVKICCPSNAPPTPVKPVEKNVTSIVIANCERYKDYQFEIRYDPPQFPGDIAVRRREKVCVNTQTLINNGEPALPREFPHMALIGFGSNFKNVEWACGGSLISEKFVLSAAHCGSSSLGEPKWALLGALSVKYQTDNLNNTKPKVYNIVRRFNHPNYKSPSVYNDIALYELSPSVEMSPFVRPACLYTANTYTDGPRASITGWGTTGAAEQRSNKLLKATIAFQDEEICKSGYSTTRQFPRGYDSSTMICAGDLVTGNDTCQGDSGGPMQVPLNPNESCMWSVVGITSVGPGICGAAEIPAIYTKVFHYLQWIQKIVWP